MSTLGFGTESITDTHSPLKHSVLHAASSVDSIVASAARIQEFFAGSEWDVDADEVLLRAQQQRLQVHLLSIEDGQEVAQSLRCQEYFQRS